MTSPDFVWRLPPSRLVLSSSDVHVWCAFIDQVAPNLSRLGQTLSADERARAERFHFERDRNRFIASQGILRLILGRYANVEPARIRFSHGLHGKPTLAASCGEGGLGFNSSHSRGLLLYAVTRDREIGVDVEYIRPLPDLQQIAAQFFSAGENAALRMLPADQRLKAFFDCWTRKEAYLKATGEGLSQPLDQFEVSLSPEEPARLIRVERDPQEAARWSLQALAPAPGYAAALAVEGQGWHLACWRWTEQVVTAAQGD
jgi:4'-phosphopantetheinyl transferase